MLSKVHEDAIVSVIKILDFILWCILNRLIQETYTAMQSFKIYEALSYFTPHFPFIPYWHVAS